MNTGALIRRGFTKVFAHASGMIEVIRNYGTPAQSSGQMRAMKNSEEGHPEKVLFQFIDPADIKVGDVIHQSGTRDLWSVTETEDNVVGDVFLMREAWVTKLD